MKPSKIQLFLLIYFLINGITFFIFKQFNINIISIILGTIISIIVIYLYSLFVKYKKINIDSSIILLLPILIILLINIFKNTIDFISYNYLINFPVLIIIITVVLISIFIIKENAITLYKTIEISSYICFIIFIISLIPLIKEVNITNIIYGFKTSSSLIYKSLLFSMYQLCSFLLLASIDTNNINDIKNIKVIIKSYVISNLLIIIKYLLIVGILSNKLISVYKYPFINILKSVKFYDFIDHLEKLLGFEYLFYDLILLFTILFGIKNIVIIIKQKIVSKII